LRIRRCPDTRCLLLADWNAAQLPLVCVTGYPYVLRLLPFAAHAAPLLGYLPLFPLQDYPSIAGYHPPPAVLHTPRPTHTPPRLLHTWLLPGVYICILPRPRLHYGLPRTTTRLGWLDLVRLPQFPFTYPTARCATLTPSSYLGLPTFLVTRAFRCYAPGLVWLLVAGVDLRLDV